MWHMWVRFIWVKNVLPDMTRTTHIFTAKSKEGNSSANTSAHIQVKKLEHCCQIESRHLMLTVQVSHQVFQNQFGSKTASGSNIGMSKQEQYKANPHLDLWTSPHHTVSPSSSPFRLAWRF